MLTFTLLTSLYTSSLPLRLSSIVNLAEEAGLAMISLDHMSSQDWPSSGSKAFSDRFSANLSLSAGNEDPDDGQLTPSHCALPPGIRRARKEQVDV
jgi:hypothetical protein